MRRDKSQRHRLVLAISVSLVCTMLPASAPQAVVEQGSQPLSNWADWVEPDFPFFSSVLDARRAGAGFPANNLTPRGLVLNLGRGHWVGFDTDLLRVAAMWRGNGVTPKALAPGSYTPRPQDARRASRRRRSPMGRSGSPTASTPGGRRARRPSFDDPREPAPSPEEVGRGPLPEEMGRFKAVAWCAAAWCSNTRPAAPTSANG